MVSAKPEKGKKKAPELRLISCVNCGTENQSSDVRCSKCGYIIDPQEMKKKLDEVQNKDSKIDKLESQMAILLSKFESLENINKAIRIKEGKK